MHPTEAARTLECRCFQRGRCTTDSASRKRIELTARGIELRHPQHDRVNEEPALIPWRDVLGAAVLTPDVAALVPGYTPPTQPQSHAQSAAMHTNPPHPLEFVVFGCLPQRDALAWDAPSGVTSTIVSYLSSVLTLLACFGRSNDTHSDIPTTTTTTATTANAAQQPTPVDHSNYSSNSNNSNTLDDDVKCERVLVQWVFQCTAPDAAALVSDLVATIQRFADPRSRSGTNPAPSLRPRRFLVLVNPAGGSGTAQQLLKTIVAPLLQQSAIAFDVVMTQYQHHARTIVHELQLETFDCVVAVGGDGLLSEIVQGLMQRSDWRNAIQQPLGIVPGGSGNGLAASLLHRSHEAMTPLNATYALVKGTVNDLDLASVANCQTHETMYSFLSLEWAFIADVDVDSERFRLFGGLRFTLASIAKLLTLTSQYSGTLRYVQSDGDRKEPAKYHASDSESEFDPNGPRPMFTHSDTNEPTDQWMEIRGSFHMFWAMSVSHAAADGFIAPSAAPDDGFYYLMLMAGPFSRLNLIRMLLGIESGTHVGKPQVQLIRTRAFTLTVDDPHDVLCVDGERFEGPQLEVEVHRGLGRIVCLAPDRRLRFV